MLAPALMARAHEPRPKGLDLDFGGQGSGWCAGRREADDDESVGYYSGYEEAEARVWSIRQVSDERLARAVWATGRPLAAPQRLCAEVVENLDYRPASALRATGANGVTTFLYASLPMSLTRFSAYSLYRWEIAIPAPQRVGPWR